MKFKSIALSVISAALVLTGCSSNNEKQPEKPLQSSSDFVSEPDANRNEPAYTNGATQLSVKNGALDINRRPFSEKSSRGNGWTILVYLCGTDLESNGGCATNDIIEAISASYSEDVHIVYQTGGTNQWNSGISNSTIQRYASTNGDIELVDELTEASMGKSETLADFVAWGLENYPAENMGLVFWNHGGGSISGVCFDEKYDKDSLSLREIDSALNSIYDKMPEKFEFIGFDACLMSTLETANILVPYANYMFASEETEPGGGWNYTDILNFLAENPDANGAELGEMQVESYVNHCDGTGDEDIVTFAITDLSKLDELLVSFDKTAKEIYESGNMNEIARAITGVDNFGGNNRSEGYTNMVDLKGLLNAVKSCAPSASDTIEKLDNAVIFKYNGAQHANAGGLSLYYPLAVQGSQELSVFSNICTSSWYLAFVDKVAYGTTGGDFNGYDNSGIFSDCDDLWDCDYCADNNVGINSDEFNFCGDDCTIGVESVYINDDGLYTVQLNNSDYFNYASCCVFMELEGKSLYLGEDDDVTYNENEIVSNFNGMWVCLNGMPLPIELVCKNENESIFTCPILLNGKETNLRISYNWNTSEWNVHGVWGGIDAQTGCAARETVHLKNGDKIVPVYTVLTSESDALTINGEEYVVNGKIEIGYADLGEGDFTHSIILYDIFGNYYFTDSASVYASDDGTIYYQFNE